jgi:hypothetical protein
VLRIITDASDDTLSTAPRYQHNRLPKEMFDFSKDPESMEEFVRYLDQARNEQINIEVQDR